MCNEREILNEFYKHYLQWVDNGAPEHPIFKRDVGLCGQLHRHVSVIYRDNNLLALDVGFLLKQDLIGDGLDTHYPFGGSSVFLEERFRRTMHLNEERIAWVRSNSRITFCRFIRRMWMVRKWNKQNRKHYKS